MEEDYGPCKFCGAKLVLNPRTGKIFCADKCWLKGEGEPKATAEVANQSTMSALQAVFDQLNQLEKKIDKLLEEQGLDADVEEEEGLDVTQIPF